MSMESGSALASIFDAMFAVVPIATIPLKPSRKPTLRSEEHTSELQSLMRISYVVFCLKKRQYDFNQRAYACCYNWSSQQAQYHRLQLLLHFYSVYYNIY